MKITVISVSIIMLIGLGISMFIYPKTIGISQLNQPSMESDQDYSNHSDQQQTDPQLYPVDPNERISYTLQEEQLNITFDHGTSWIRVPIEKDQLFNGEYNGNKQELINQSYVLSEDRAAFLYADSSHGERQSILMLSSTDQGKTWQENLVVNSFPGVRFRKLDFLTEQFGYVIISGGRTMSQEASFVYVTKDSGVTWSETTNTGVTRLIHDGGFIDESTGFLSYGTINPVEPDLYVTEDSGNTWSKAEFDIPAKYVQIFVQAEVPVLNGDHLELLVNQGPNGDYKGGLVKGKFISKDNGKTWGFETEVDPNETE